MRQTKHGCGAAIKVNCPCMQQQQKVEGLRPGLYLVATPIGNLQDITLRALRILRECDLIACEDTRHTQQLLNYFEIKTPTVSYHKHNERERTNELVPKLQSGTSIALVSDAGMPGISDPGNVLINTAIREQISVIPIPGPSAFVCALAASGLPAENFTFRGFLPARPGARRTALEGIRDLSETVIVYEAPHRIAALLKDITEVLGHNRRIVIARELTKIHEEFLRGTAAELAEKFAPEDVKGEIVLLIAPPEAASTATMNWSRFTPTQRLRELMEKENIAEKTALRTVAREFRISRSEAYRELQKIKLRR